jgi:signal transduction histidine kinase
MLDFKEDGLTESHKLMLYRIIQEQINNIIKHAQAQHITVVLKKTESTVQLTIADDGKGVDLSEAGLGLGLRNIRNRIELYHGSIDMVSSPGNGFTLKVEFEV